MSGAIDRLRWSRSVAQPGSAPRSGRGGRRFKSCHSDHFPHCSRNFLPPGGRAALSQEPKRTLRGIGRTPGIRGVDRRVKRLGGIYLRRLYRPCSPNWTNSQGVAVRNASCNANPRNVKKPLPPRMVENAGLNCRISRASRFCFPAVKELAKGDVDGAGQNARRKALFQTFSMFASGRDKDRCERHDSCHRQGSLFRRRENSTSARCVDAKIIHPFHPGQTFLSTGNLPLAARRVRRPGICRRSVMILS